MKRLFTTMVAVLIALSITAQKTRMSVNVKQPGTLAACIGEINKKSVEKLTIKGKLNSADVIFLREMAGHDSSGNQVKGNKLTSLNLRKATFMADTTCFLRRKDKDLQTSLGKGGADLPDFIFFGCTLGDIVFPEGMQRIGKQALAYTKLTSITLPEYVSLESLAFANCKELTQVTFPHVINEIHYGSFWGCDKLEHLDINNIILLAGHSILKMKSLRSLCINGWCIHADDLCFDCPELKTIDFYGDILLTGGILFAQNCPKLETVTFHASVYKTNFAKADSCQAFKGFVANDLVISAYKDIIPISPLEDIASRYESLKANLNTYEAQYHERLAGRDMDQLEQLVSKGMERSFNTARRCLNEATYNMACQHSLNNEREKALDLFEKVVSGGLREYYHFLQDSDLNNIREEARFKAMMADLKKTEDKINKLKASAEYVSNGKKANVTFTYQSPSDSILTAIREYFNLDSIAGGGNEISRIKRIMYWLHDAIRHDGSSSWPKCRYNAIELYELTQRENRGLNCRFMSEVLNDLYLAAGFKSRFVTCQSKEYDTDGDCHVINIVWSNELGKWVWMDASFAAYVTGESGLLLHPGEVRERLRKDLPIILNEDANWNHKNPQTKDYYIDYYMAKNLYLLSSHERSETESEGEGGKNSPTVTLVPHGFGYILDKVTEDYAEFWQRP